MPYIENKDRREALDINPWAANNPGELTYVLTRMVLDYLPADPHYADYAQVDGILDLLKHEFQRRAVDSYEETKLSLNGDVGYEDLPQNRK